jgi:DNA transformation protein and related proteins
MPSRPERTARPASRTTRTRPRVSDAFKQFVLDQLEDLGDVEPRTMFGCYGLYSGGVFFAILAGDMLYLKVDDETRPGYERAKSAPFRPFPKRPASRNYYAVPVSVLENAPELTRWARRAVGAAERAPRTRARKR